MNSHNSKFYLLIMATFFLHTIYGADSALTSFNTLAKELQREVVVCSPEPLTMRLVCKNFNEWVTGFSEPGKMGKDITLPAGIYPSFQENTHIDIRFYSATEINVQKLSYCPIILNCSNKLRMNTSGIKIDEQKLRRDQRIYAQTIEDISCFLWYHVSSSANNIPVNLWPYLSGTRITSFFLNSSVVDTTQMSETITSLCSTARTMPNLKSIAWAKSHMNNEQASALFQGLAGIDVTRLSIEHAHLDPQNLIPFFTDLGKTSIRYLDVKFNAPPFPASSLLNFVELIKKTKLGTIVFDHHGDKPQFSLIEKQLPNVKIMVKQYM